MPHAQPGTQCGATQNFQEVALGYTAEMAVNEAQRCLQCKNHPCRSGCPVDIDIPGFIAHVAKANLRKLQGHCQNPARCPPSAAASAPRKTSARANVSAASRARPVGIGRLERFVADWYRENVHTKPEMPTPTATR